MEQRRLAGTLLGGGRRRRSEQRGDEARHQGAQHARIIVCGSDVSDPISLPWLDRDDPFPPLSRALREPNGLLAAGADLSPERLVDAYSRGIYPWFNEDDPILWWSPDPRMVLFLPELHVSRSLRKVVTSGVFEVTADRAFTAVMQGCAAPRDEEGGTWITGEMATAYAELARRGIAHSVEVWRDGVLEIGRAHV